MHFFCFSHEQKDINIPLYKHIYKHIHNKGDQLNHIEESIIIVIEIIEK